MTRVQKTKIARGTEAKKKATKRTGSKCNKDLNFLNTNSLFKFNREENTKHSKREEKHERSSRREEQQQDRDSREADDERSSRNERQYDRDDYRNRRDDRQPVVMRRYWDRDNPGNGRRDRNEHDAEPAIGERFYGGIKLGFSFIFANVMKCLCCLISTGKPAGDKPPQVKRVSEKKTVDLLTSKTGGAYIPPAKLRMMQAQITDKSSEAYQRIAWEALKKSIHGHINKINTSNIGLITRELLRENIVRGRGLLARSIIQAQTASPTFTNVYAALTAIINSKVKIFNPSL